MKRFALLSLAVLVSVASFFAAPRSALAMRNYGPHSGYVADIHRERDQQYEDMTVLELPQDDGPSLRERIFNAKLSKEFSDRYEEKFGRTEAERAYYAPNRFTYYDDVYGMKGSEQDITDERRKFGEYMVRRLAEYHVDNYAKTSQTTRAIWEAKDRFSQVKLEVNKFRFDAKYDLAGNVFDLNVVNPYVKLFRIRMQMNQGAFGPSNPDETIISIGRDITKTLSFESFYYWVDGVISVTLHKSLAPALWGTLTTSTFTRDHGRNARESLYLSGLSYTF